jgi:hypothetical protein
MTGRGAIAHVFGGGPPARPVVCVRMRLWHQDALARGALPDDVSGLTRHKLASHLGFAAAVRHREYLRFDFERAERRSRQEGDVTTDELVLPGRTLTTVSRATPEMVRAGMRGHIVKHALDSPDDYQALTEAFESVRIEIDDQGFAALDAESGDRGLPMAILGVSPAHRVALEYAGYERFYYHLHDHPGLVADLIGAIDRRWREDLWPKVAAGPARLILHGAHFSQSMTPRPVFRRYFAPYFHDFVAEMHAAGKWVCCHSDTDLGELMADVADAGFDCAECLATAPLVPETLSEYTDAWAGRIIAWGGLPSVIFDPTYPMADYCRLVREVLCFAQGRRDVVIGASDNVMPGAEWRRLEFLAEALREVSA